MPNQGFEPTRLASPLKKVGPHDLTSLESCSLLNIFCSRSTELLKIPLRELTHAGVIPT